METDRCSWASHGTANSTVDQSLGTANMFRRYLGLRHKTYCMPLPVVEDEKHFSRQIVIVVYPEYAVRDVRRYQTVL